MDPVQIALSSAGGISSQVQKDLRYDFEFENFKEGRWGNLRCIQTL